MSVEAVSYEEELTDIQAMLLASSEQVGTVTRDATEVIETLNPFHDAHHVAEVHDKPPTTLAELLAHHEAHPLVLNVLMLRHFGSEYLGWLLPTVERALHQFGVPSDLTVAKVMATQLCHTSEAPWVDWRAFSAVASAFSDILPDFEAIQPIDPIQATVAVGIMNTLEERDLWSDEVKRFLSTVFHYNQMMLPLPPLTFVSVDGHWLHHDREKIMRLWPEVKRTGKVPNEAGIEEEQLRKMLLVAEAQQIFLNRLRQQLPLVTR